MSDIKGYLKNAGILTLQGVVQKTFGIIASIVLARGLEPSAFGIYNAVLNTANSGYGLVRFGVDAAIHVYTADKEDSHKEGILGGGLLLLILAGVIGAVVSYLLSDWLAIHIFEQPELSQWLKFASLLIFLQCLSQFCYAALVGLHQFKRYAVVMVSMGAVNLAVLVCGIYFLGLVGAIIAAIIVQMGTVVWLTRILKIGLCENKLRIRLIHLWENLKRIVTLGFPFYLAGLVAVPITYYMQGVLSRSGGIEALGYLRIIASINSIILFIPSSIGAATISFLARANTDTKISKSRFVEYSLLNLKLVWLFCLGVALPLWMVAPFLVQLVYGSEYLEVVPAVRIGVFVAVCLVVINLASQTFFAQRKVGLVFLQTVLYSGILLALGSVLIPYWGIFGYIIAELVGYGIVCGIIVGWFIYSGKTTGVSVFPIIILLVLTISLITILTFVAQKHDELLNGSIGIFLIIVAAGIGYRFVLGAYERNRVNQLIVEKLKRHIF